MSCTKVDQWQQVVVTWYYVICTENQLKNIFIYSILKFSDWKRRTWTMHVNICTHLKHQAAKLYYKYMDRNQTVKCDWHEYCRSNSTAVIFDLKWTESLVPLHFKVSLLQSSYKFKYWVIAINNMHLLSRVRVWFIVTLNSLLLLLFTCSKDTVK